MVKLDESALDAKVSSGDYSFNTRIGVTSIVECGGRRVADDGGLL